MKILKPTLWASVVFAIPPTIFLWRGWLNMQSPDWGTTDAELKGFAVIFIASLIGFLCVVLIFPSIAKLLGASFTSHKWVHLNIIAIILMAFTATGIFESSVGYSSFTALFFKAYVMSIPFAMFCLAMLAPSMYIWLRIFKAVSK